MLPVRAAVDVLVLKMEGWIISPFGGKKKKPHAGMKIRAISSNSMSKIICASTTDPASLCQTPIGLQTQREEARGRRRAKGRLEEEQGSSCTNSFSVPRRLRISLCTPVWSESLENIAKCRETETKLTSGHYSNLFFELYTVCILCTFLFFQYQKFN